VRATVLLDGVAVGTWAARVVGAAADAGVAFAIDTFGGGGLADAADAAAVRAEAAAMAEGFWGRPLADVRID